LHEEQDRIEIIPIVHNHCPLERYSFIYSALLKAKIGPGWIGNIAITVIHIENVLAGLLHKIEHPLGLINFANIDEHPRQGRQSTQYGLILDPYAGEPEVHGTPAKRLGLIYPTLFAIRLYQRLK
jgi:hypothetical protein